MKNDDEISGTATTTKNDEDENVNLADIPGMIAVRPHGTDEDDKDFEEVSSIVKTLQEMHPEFVVNPNRVYALLEAERANPDRKKNVIDRLIAELKNGSETEHKIDAAPLVIPEENVPEKFKGLMNDVEAVRKFVPNKSREEILAYLEAFHDNPNRVRIVVGELLDLNGIPAVPRANGEQLTNATSTDERNNEKSAMMETVGSILELFPDADPEYLRGFVENYTHDVNFINATVSGWMENRSYPKKGDVQRTATKRKFVENNFSVEEFLEMFPDAENYFQNYERVVTPSYKLHVKIYVENQFRKAFKDDLARVMIRHNYHLTPIMKELNASWNVSPTDEPVIKKRKDMPQRKRQASALKAMPQVTDELFYKEKLFIEMENRIKQYRKDKITERRDKIEKGRKMGELMECACCFDDELLIEDMLHCSDGHLFCRTCIRQQAETNIGQGRYKFPCLDAYCDTEFPLVVLQNVLSSNVFSNLVRKMQEEEIRCADIPDLESCPHCSFCAIMPDADLKIFRCRNPECLKVTCRLCKEPNHLPLRCDEIEQKSEVRYRTFIEDQMTDALLRTCPRCKRRIVKDYGCNKMTCSCGQIFCYVCREPIVDYEHFRNGKCPQFSNDAELHRLEVQEGAKNAKKEYMDAHPELQTVELRHDPTKTPFTDLPNLRRNQQQYAQNAAMPLVNQQGQIVFQPVPRPPLVRPVLMPRLVGPAPRPPLVGPAPRPPLVGPAPRPPLVRPAPRPFLVGPAPRPFLVGPAPRPPLVGPQPRPPLVQPAPRPPLVGPAPRPPFVRPAPRPPP